MINLQIINNLFDNYILDKLKILNILNSIVTNENKEFDSLNIILQDDEYLRILKQKYFNQDIYTDVISFNLEDSHDPIDGEIYVSIPRIIDNAKKYKIDLNDEFKRILIHGILHLVGYNDNTKKDKIHMTKLENYYININKGIIITL